MPNLEENFTKLRSRITLACENSPGRAKNVQLVAVSKRHPAQSIRTLHGLGQSDFAENYLQEALAKQSKLADLDICWHFIGSIQKNKTRTIAQAFDWVHSIDRLIIAERLSNQRDDQLDALNICLQVNIDQEDSKSGFSLPQLRPAAEEIAQLPRIRLRGLMAIPSALADPSQQRASMAAMKHAFDELQAQHPTMDTLSMGMSRDLEIAIDAGATMLRVGEALFGPRPK